MTHKFDDDTYTANVDIAKELREHRSEVSRCLNPSELWAPMCAANLVQPSQYEDFCKSKGVEVLLQAVEKSKSHSAYIDFLECLENSKEHLGHVYVASVLRRQPFASQAEINSSAALKKNIQDNMSAMLDMEVDALIPFLMKRHLLTCEETELLRSKTTTTHHKKRVLLCLLESKGPTAHYLFATCLQEEGEHPTHHQLLHLISSGNNENNHCRPQQKRKALPEDLALLEDLACPTVKVTKRDPNKVKAFGTLNSQFYFDKIKEIRRLHYFARWEAAENIVEECRLSGNQELYVGVMLRNCSGYVTRKQMDVVSSTVEEAKRLCNGIDNDNGVILRIRCEWMLAKMHRYMKNCEEAQKHVKIALSYHYQYNVQAGEDSALCNYCQACILLESVSKNWCPEKVSHARQCLKTATDHAVLGDYGLYVSHHLIRLAQLCLHSSKHQADSQSLLKEAGDALRGVDEDILAPRTSCLFYLTKSDLYRNMKRGVEARKYAEMAHDIAQSYNFKTELHSAMQALKDVYSDKKGLN